MSKGVVEGVVNVGHGDAEACRGVAVDHKLGAKALVLKVAGYIGNDTFLAELGHHLACVLCQFSLIRIFEGILKLGAAYTVFNSEILKRLQKELNALNA